MQYVVARTEIRSTVRLILQSGEQVVRSTYMLARILTRLHDTSNHLLLQPSCAAAAGYEAERAADAGRPLYGAQSVNRLVRVLKLHTDQSLS